MWLNQGALATACAGCTTHSIVGAVAKRGSDAARFGVLITFGGSGPRQPRARKTVTKGMATKVCWPCASAGQGAWQPRACELRAWQPRWTDHVLLRARVLRVLRKIPRSPRLAPVVPGKLIKYIRYIDNINVLN